MINTARVPLHNIFRAFTTLSKVMVIWQVKVVQIRPFSSNVTQMCHLCGCVKPHSTAVKDIKDLTNICTDDSVPIILEGLCCYCVVFLMKWPNVAKESLKMKFKQIAQIKEVVMFK